MPRSVSAAHRVLRETRMRSLGVLGKASSPRRSPAKVVVLDMHQTTSAHRAGGEDAIRVALQLKVDEAVRGDDGDRPGKAANSCIWSPLPGRSVGFPSY